MNWLRWWLVLEWTAFWCFMMLEAHPFVWPGPEPGPPPQSPRRTHFLFKQSPPLSGCSLCWSSIILLVLPYPHVSPPLPPCLLHTGTLPFGETDWLWWGRRWGSDKEYSCAQGSLLHRPSCRISLLSLKPHAVAGETAERDNLRIRADKLAGLTLQGTETHTSCPFLINTHKAFVIRYVIQG